MSAVSLLHSSFGQAVGPFNAAQVDAGHNAYVANCLTCHSAGMVLNQPDLTRAAWQGEVMKMIKFYHAPINAADIPAIVDYLVKTKGAN